jgi:hypothetical protein
MKQAKADKNVVKPLNVLPRAQCFVGDLAGEQRLCGFTLRYQKRRLRIGQLGLYAGNSVGNLV